MKSLPAVGLAAALALVPAMARAQGSYLSTPTGGRSALTGNTGVALGRDGSAPFVNPATIVGIYDSRIAFSVNFYSFTATSLGAYHQPGVVDPGVFPNVASTGTTATDMSFGVLPSTLCFFFLGSGAILDGDDSRPRRHKGAVCIGNTERSDVSLPALNFRAKAGGGITQQGGSLTRKWTRWHAGPTYATHLTERLSVGLSVHGVYSYYGYHDDNTTVTTGGPGGAVTSNLGASAAGYSLDLNAILGAAYEIGHYTVGLSVQLPSLHITSGFDANLHEQYAGAAVPTSRLTTGSGNFVAAPPVRISAGIGADWGRTKVELDSSFYFALNPAIQSAAHVDELSVNGAAATTRSFDAIYDVRAKPTLNVSAGGEYFIAPTFSAMAGVSTDLTAIPALDTSVSLGNFYKDRMNRVMLSAGIGSYTDSGDLLVGTQLLYGWGQSLAENPYVVPNAYAVIDARQYGVMLILAGSRNLKALGRAVESVGDILRKGRVTAPEPKPDGKAGGP